MKSSKARSNFVTGIVLNTVVSLNLAFPGYVFAEKNSKGSLAGAMQVGTSLFQQAGSVIAQSRANAQAKEQFERLNLALTPVEVTNSYFPGCKTLPAMTPEVFQACKAQPRSSTQANILKTILSKAAENRRKYTEYSTIGNSRVANPDPNGTQNINNGLQCVQDRVDNTKQLLDKRISDITDLLNSMNKSKEILEANMQPDLDSLNELDAFITGGNALNSDHTRKYGNLFRQLGNDNSCGSILDTANIQDLLKGGLNSVEKQVNSIRTGGNGGSDRVTELIRNQGNIQASIKKYASDLRTAVRKRGIDRVSGELTQGGLSGLDLKASFGFDNPPALADAIKNQMRQYNDNRLDLDDQFGKLGINRESSLGSSIFGDKDNNFSRKLKRWRDEQQDECLRRKISVSKSNNYDYFLSLIDHVDTRIRSKSNLGTLRAELKKHLDNNNLSIEQKVKQVQKILGKKSYRQVKIFSEDTDDSNSIKGDKNPVSLLNRYANACKDEYRRIEVNSEGQTLMEMEKEAKRINKEFKDQEKKIPTLLANSIYDRVINCRQDGQPVPYSLSSNSCNADKLSLESPSFCLGQSVECAKTINTCSQKIEDTIVRVTAQGAAVAKKINTQVQNFRNLQKTLLNNYLAQAKTQAGQLQTIFENSNFQLPDDLSLPNITSTVGNPSDLHATYNPEDLMEGFEDKMKELRSSMEAQNTLVMQEMAKEQQKIAQNYQTQDQHWEELENRCHGLIEQYNQAEAQRVAEVKKQQAEQLKELNKFCYDYDKFQVGPGCDKQLDDLDETARNIAGTIDTSAARSYLNTIRMRCAGNQQEASKVEDVFCASLVTGVTGKNRQDELDKLFKSEIYQSRCLPQNKTTANTDNDESNLTDSQLTQRRPVLANCASINDHGTTFNSISSAIDRAGNATLEFMTRK